MLRLDLSAASLVHWSTDGWKTRNDARTNDVGLGIYSVEIPTAGLAIGATIVFTWLDIATNKWTGQDCTVTVAPPFATQ